MHPESCKPLWPVIHTSLSCPPAAPPPPACFCSLLPTHAFPACSCCTLVVLFCSCLLLLPSCHAGAAPACSCCTHAILVLLLPALVALMPYWCCSSLLLLHSCHTGAAPACSCCTHVIRVLLLPACAHPQPACLCSLCVTLELSAPAYLPWELPRRVACQGTSPARKHSLPGPIAHPSASPALSECILFTEHAPPLAGACGTVVHEYFSQCEGAKPCAHCCPHGRLRFVCKPHASAAYVCLPTSSVPAPNIRHTSSRHCQPSHTPLAGACVRPRWACTRAHVCTNTHTQVRVRPAPCGVRAFAPQAIRQSLAESAAPAPTPTARCATPPPAPAPCASPRPGGGPRGSISGAAGASTSEALQGVPPDMPSTLHAPGDTSISSPQQVEAHSGKSASPSVGGRPGPAARAQGPAAAELTGSTAAERMAKGTEGPQGQSRGGTALPQQAACGSSSGSGSTGHATAHASGLADMADSGRSSYQVSAWGCCLRGAGALMPSASAFASKGWYPPLGSSRLGMCVLFDEGAWHREGDITRLGGCSSPSPRLCVPSPVPACY